MERVKCDLIAKCKRSTTTLDRGINYRVVEVIGNYKITVINKYGRKVTVNADKFRI